MEKTAVVRATRDVNVKYSFDDEDDSIELDDCDRNHISHLLSEGYVEGELNHGLQEVKGWWSIIK